jgi:hypothetical protein
MPFSPKCSLKAAAITPSNKSLLHVFSNISEGRRIRKNYLKALKASK